MIKSLEHELGFVYMNNRLNLAGIIRESIVDGPGMRMVLFAQGCIFRCPGCHNPNAQEFSGGEEFTADDIIDLARSNPILSGLTFSGGEPFCQAEIFAELAAKAHESGLNIVTYTGFTIEQLLGGIDDNPGWHDLLMQTDTLIDGPFIQEERDLLLRFRGSRNQRILDSRASVKAGYAVEKGF